MATTPTDVAAAVTAAARRFDWVGLEQRMVANCRCGMTADELWGANGADADGTRPTYDPADNPCPACRDAVRPFVIAALRATTGVSDGGDVTCPDGGTCHHSCVSACFRVSACGPLTGAYDRDEWPAHVTADPTPVAIARG